MDKQEWINETMRLAKGFVQDVFGGRGWRPEENRKWVENTKGAWYLEGTPPKGTVIIHDDESSITACGIEGQTLEFKYPESPEKIYMKWYHDFYKRDDMDMRVTTMIRSKATPEEIVSAVVDTVLSDIRKNPKKNIDVLREEWRVE